MKRLFCFCAESDYCFIAIFLFCFSKSGKFIIMQIIIFWLAWLFHFFVYDVIILPLFLISSAIFMIFFELAYTKMFNENPSSYLQIQKGFRETRERIEKQVVKLN
jgi:hypothetical protein